MVQYPQLEIAVNERENLDVFFYNYQNYNLNP